MFAYTSVLLVLFSTLTSGAPMILEGEIHPKESMIKVHRPSFKLLQSLETHFDVLGSELFDLHNLKHVADMDLDAIENEASKDYIISVLVSPNIDGSNSFLMAPLALPDRILEKILSYDAESFLQILLPNHDEENNYQIMQSSEDPNIQNSSSPSVMITREVPPEVSNSKFYRQFLKLDLNKENQFIPESVRIALKNVQQVLIHPKTFLQVPEGQTNADSVVYTLTNAVPTNVTLGLFEIIQ